MFIYRKQEKEKEQKKEKCFRGWPGWRFHGWLNVRLMDTETHLEGWLAEFFMAKIRKRVDVFLWLF